MVRYLRESNLKKYFKIIDSQESLSNTYFLVQESMSTAIADLNEIIENSNFIISKELTEEQAKSIEVLNEDGSCIKLSDADLGSCFSNDE
jgi:hypothetical protein